MPNLLLKKILPRVKKKTTALDIGAGSGKDAALLIASGFRRVEAIDKDAAAIAGLKKLRTRRNWGQLKARTVDVRKFKFSPKTYDLILALFSLIWMKKGEFVKIIQNIKKSLRPGGVAVIAGLTTQDPSFADLKKFGVRKGKNTFFSKTQKRYWQFLSRNELKKYFRKGCTTLYYTEKRVRDKPHGKITKPHFHGIAEIAVQKI